MNQPHTILVVEDESSIASFVALYLKNAGYVVKTVPTGSGALNQIAAGMPSMIILDLNLPDMDGIEICRRIRKSSDVPILMLTARDEDVDKIIGLEVGADDYLTKPFNPRELVARVKSVLRRAGPERRRDEMKELHHGELSINAGKREVYVGDDEIQLAPKEFDLLWELLDHRGLVLTRDQLLERVWATRLPVTRGPLTYMCARCGGSSATLRRSSRCGVSATRSRPNARQRPRTPYSPIPFAWWGHRGQGRCASG
jgi:DNA-binding response OmpR family regulator